MPTNPFEPPTEVNEPALPVPCLDYAIIAAGPVAVFLLGATHCGHRQLPLTIPVKPATPNHPIVIPMKLPRFTLRELFLLIVIAAMGCGWWVDVRYREAAFTRRYMEAVLEAQAATGEAKHAQFKMKDMDNKLKIVHEKLAWLLNKNDQLESLLKRQKDQHAP